MFRRFRFAVFLFPALTPAAFACQICVPFPKKSAADYLIEADIVVLAREDPERSFHFRAVEVLKGEPGDEPIDLFLDSSTRRHLTYYPSRSVILARSTEKGKAKWNRIGTADEETEPVARQIVAREESWKKNPKQRTDFFSDYLGHRNLQLRDLAHLEIGRAPYYEIRRFHDALPREQLLQFLADARYVEWRALYILFLSQSEDPRDRARIEESFQTAVKFDIETHLSAWATAYIEWKQQEALAAIEQHYFANPDRSADEIRAVLLAASVQGTNGHVHLRDRIVQGYRTLLKHHPAMAPAVAGDLTKWKRRDLAKDIEQILAHPPESLDFLTLVRLRTYLRKAGRP